MVKYKNETEKLVNVRQNGGFFTLQPGETKELGEDKKVNFLAKAKGLTQVTGKPAPVEEKKPAEKFAVPIKKEAPKGASASFDKINSEIEAKMYLDNNSRTVLGDLAEIKLSKHDLKKLYDYEISHRNSTQVLTYLERRIK